MPLGARAASYSFTTIDYPGATSTQVIGINAAGQLVGLFVDTSNVAHGFARDRGPTGTFTPVDAPSASFTAAHGINDHGEIVGRFRDDTGIFGFVASPDSTFTSFTFTRFAYPSATNTEPYGINDDGQIVGWAAVAGTVHGFVRTPGGRFAPIDVPGAISTRSFGINTANQVSGGFDAAGSEHGFLGLPQSVSTSYTFLSFDAPGTTNASARGLNDDGLIVGFVRDGDQVHGFVRSPDPGPTGAFARIAVPGATQTLPFGINIGCGIVGVYLDVNGVEHGFVATPTVVIPFAAFAAQVVLSVGQHWFGVSGTFTPGVGNNGIAPDTEPVTLQIGTFSTTIPANAFQPHTVRGVTFFTFNGTVEGVALAMAITPLGGGRYAFTAGGQGADLTGTANPVPVTLGIGDDSGTTTVTAIFK